MFLQDIYSPLPSRLSSLSIFFSPGFAITQSKGIEWEATCEQLQMPQCQHGMAWQQAILFVVRERELDWMVHFWHVQWFVFVFGSVKTTIW